jgi:hypothetical protein
LLLLKRVEEAIPLLNKTLEFRTARYFKAKVFGNLIAANEYTQNRDGVKKVVKSILETGFEYRLYPRLMNAIQTAVR